MSFAAQYRYFLAERHQIIAVLIESGALDVGMIIFALLALGAARKGLHARPERVADRGLRRSVGPDELRQRRPGRLAVGGRVDCMPPIFLAVVADRVIAITRRHLLGMAEGRSAWRDALAWLARVARALAFLALYSLRFLLAPPSTAKGVRQAVLNATPLPAPPPVLELPSECPPPSRPSMSPAARCLQCGTTPPWGTVHVCPGPPNQVAEQPSLHPRRAYRSDDGMTKTERLLSLVVLKHGDLAGIPLRRGLEDRHGARARGRHAPGLGAQRAPGGRPRRHRRRRG